MWRKKPEIYIVKEGDTFRSISMYYYGNPTMFRNEGVPLYVGQKLYLGGRKNVKSRR